MARRETDRGLSPVVGTALMIAIVLVFAAIAGYVFLGLSDTAEPAPQVAWEAESSEDGADWRLVHGGGDRVEGKHLELHGTATPDAATDTNLSVEDEVSFYPTASEVTVVWYGEDGESYRLTTIEIEQPLPAPDEGCDWVEAESDGGSDPVTVDGIAVNCDVSTGEQITVRNGGAVIGEVVSGSKDLDLDDAAVYGDVELSKAANVQNGTVTGDVTSTNKEVKLDEAVVEGSVTAMAKAEVMDDSVVDGDVESRGGTSQISRSTVQGSVTAAAGGKVNLDDATVEGHVYADPDGSVDFECSNSTIDGQDCDSYTPRDPDDW